MAFDLEMFKEFTVADLLEFKPLPKQKQKWVLDGFKALCAYDGDFGAAQWLTAVLTYWATDELEDLPEKAGTCKNSREVVLGLLYQIDEDFALKVFKKVGEIAKRRGVENITRFRREGFFTPRRKPEGFKPVRAKPAKKAAKKPVDNDSIYSGEFAGQPSVKLVQTELDEIGLCWTTDLPWSPDRVVRVFEDHNGLPGMWLGVLNRDGELVAE